MSTRVLVTAAFFATAVFAQIDTGSIVGSVRDPSGAAIPKASILVTNTATGVIVATRTNSQGQYQVAALIPGRYSVKVTAPGFQSAFRDAIDISVQSRPAMDFALSLGQSTETLEVKAENPVLQTESADIGSVVQDRQIRDLPLNGRRYSDLALLEAGIHKNQQVLMAAPDRFSSNGNWETQNYFSLDGIDNNSGSTNLQEGSVQVVQPPPDALQEFRVQTLTYSAEFGTSAGAVVNASLKSGTNHIHGDLWEFIRNSAVDANTFFNNKNGVPLGRYVQNQYGGTIGLPILKNRTFFFGDTQFFSSRKAVTTQQAVPTPLMHHGSFTELSTALRSSPIAGQGACIQNNIIAMNCIDPVAARLLALLPLPNIPSAVARQGIPGSWTGGPNYQYVFSKPHDTHSWDFRVDHVLDDGNRIFGRFSSMNGDSVPIAPWTSNPIVGNGNYATRSVNGMHSVALGWLSVLNPAMLNELRGGFNRDNARNLPVGVDLGTSVAAQYGLTGIPMTPFSAGLPPIGINGLLGGTVLGIGTSVYHPQYQISQVWQLIDNLSWLKGKHGLKFGYEYRHMSDNFLDIRAPQGEILVSGIYTAGGTFGLPDFELGDIDQTYLVTPTVVHNYMYGHSVYFQDTWRVRPDLTLSYGLRYELFSPVLNHQNAVSNFTPAGGGGIITAASNASGWYGRSLIHPDFNDFAPRFGLSYHPFKRVVFRAGFGIFYQHYARIGSESVTALNPPFIINENLSRAIGSTTPVFLLKDGFPSFQPGPVDLATLQIRAQDPNNRTSYVQQTSFGPQIQLGGQTSLEVVYVGNFARKMTRLRNANQGMIAGFAADGSPTIVFPYANLNSTAEQHAFLEYATNDGNSSYNGLLISLRRRFNEGLSYGANYTYSHGISDFVDILTSLTQALPQNSYDYKADRGNAPFDVRHRFVAFGSYELPVGKGKALLNGDRIAARVLGGWQVNAIVTMQTGTPYEVNAPDESGTGIGQNDPRANCVGDPFAGTNSNPRVGPLLNYSAFALPAPGTFGNCGARVFHGPGLSQVDISLFKSFSLSESKRLEFRAEAFNALNHANFANPVSSYSTVNRASFGLVTSTLPNATPRELQVAVKLYF